MLLEILEMIVEEEVEVECSNNNLDKVVVMRSNLVCSLLLLLLIKVVCNLLLLLLIKMARNLLNLVHLLDLNNKVISVQLQIN